MKIEVQKAADWWAKRLVDMPSGALSFVTDSMGLSNHTDKIRKDLERAIAATLEDVTWDERRPQFGTARRTFGTSPQCWHPALLSDVLGCHGFSVSDTDLPGDATMHVDPGSVYVKWPQDGYRIESVWRKHG